MKKGTRLIKRMVALSLVLLLSIESFGAIVSDNDGSAFITKAEFDSLKNNFQSQIDQYNTSIDAKIDGAIAAYLAGVQLTQKETIDTLVENYRDLYWCHDFSIDAREKRWSDRNNFVVGSLDTLQPNYANQTGFAFWRSNRGTRWSVFGNSNYGGLVLGMQGIFDSDGTYTKTSMAAAANAFDYVPAVLCLKVVGDYVIDDDPLGRYSETGYNIIRWGIDHQNSFTMYATNMLARTREIQVEPLEPEDEHEYFRIKLNFKNWETATRYWIQKYNDENTYAFEAAVDTFGTSESGWQELGSDRLTYPVYSYFAASSNGATENQNRIKNMMIGTNTEYMMPFIFDLKKGGPNGIVSNTDRSPSASTLVFPDWTNWDKKPVSMQVKIGSAAASSATEASTAPANIFTTSLVSNNITMNIPVITLFNVNNLKSPTAVYNNENLNICGGIPILIKASRSGTVNIELKCTKHYDTSAKGIPTDTNAKIKFKKTTFTDSSDDYFSGTYGSETTTTKFDGNKTIDIANQKFKFSVKKGESVWMNIDPITLGQHIRITDLRCTIEYD